MAGRTARAAPLARGAAVLVLTRARPGEPPPPEAMPIGRAALTLEAEGCPVVFGDTVRDGRAWGWRARAGGWEEATALPLLAVQDRYPSWAWPEPWRAAIDAVGDRPIGNPPNLVALCRDKLSLQRRLEAAGLVMPEVEGDPARFAERLDAWGVAYLKPRNGSLGRGVRQVRAGQPLPEFGAADEPARAGQGPPGARPDTLVLQRGVPSAHADGRGGVAVRWLTQRRVDGDGWIAPLPVARVSTEDPVVNVQRGATARPAAELLSRSTLADLERQADDVCAALSALSHGDWLVELGIDFVIDDAGVGHLIEVNGAPRGRLEALAAGSPGQYAALHEEACLRPLRRLRSLGTG